VRLYIGAAAIIVGGTILLLLAVGQMSDYAKEKVVAGLVAVPAGEPLLRADRPDTGKAPRTQSPLRIAVAPVFSPETSLLMYRDFVDYLAGRLGMKGEMILRASYSEINEVLRSQQCDAAIVCTYPYVRARRDFGARLLATPEIHGSPTYRSLVIVSAGSDAGSLAGLKGKRFASADVLSTSGWLFPALWLWERGEDPDRFFGEHIITGSHDRSVLAVASGQADGAAVHSVVYDRMPVVAKEATRVVQSSPLFAAPPIVVHPGISERLFKRMQAVLLSAHEDEEGRNVLGVLGVDRFLMPDPEAYADVERLVTRWEDGR